MPLFTPRCARSSFNQGAAEYLDPLVVASPQSLSPKSSSRLFSPSVQAVFLLIHLSSGHWVLEVASRPGRYLGLRFTGGCGAQPGHPSAAVRLRLEQFVRNAHGAKEWQSWPVLASRMPYTANTFDCGVYITFCFARPSPQQHHRQSSSLKCRIVFVRRPPCYRR